MQPQIEHYLEQVKGQLKSLSPQARAEEVREMGVHLQALVEAGRDAGLGENEAVKAALAQFGSYRKVGRELNKAVRSGEKHRLPRALSITTNCMIGLNSLGLISSVVLLIFAAMNWPSSAEILGGATAMAWRYGISFANGILAISLALQLRKLRPWAFWMALIYHCNWTLIGTVKLYDEVAKISQNPSSMATNVFFLAINTTLSYFPGLTFLLLLMLNRKTYLKLAYDKYKG
jgi:hypothetical protein